MRRVFVDPEAPQRDAIQEAAKWIRAGGLVALPTDTLYGLAADPFSGAAVARVFAAKGRSAERALPLIAADADADEPRASVHDLSADDASMDFSSMDLASIDDLSVNAPDDDTA